MYEFPEFVADHCTTFEAKRLCQLLEVERSSYYAQGKAAGAARAADDERKTSLRKVTSSDPLFASWSTSSRGGRSPGRCGPSRGPAHRYDTKRRHSWCRCLPPVTYEARKPAVLQTAASSHPASKNRGQGPS
ncbi:MAG TPA: hypothetical protein VFS29_09880 [Motilibacteraceae bacterium]|nr:hypothetical protein [Motilibacteraceae bacterium]